jgi:hypothetical protein
VNIEEVYQLQIITFVVVYTEVSGIIEALGQTLKYILFFATLVQGTYLPLTSPFIFDLPKLLLADHSGCAV